jgi:peptide/nickel transport system permease protein
MGRYLVTRLLFALLLVFVVSSASLLLTRIAPGDFIDMQGLDLSQQDQKRMRESLGLNQSLASQYFSWLGGVARFDFGQSLLYSRPVGALIRERALNTAMLATTALLLATLIGIPLGIYSGTHTGAGRVIVRAISILGVSVPPLIGSLALVFLAARTGWLPVGGMTSSTGASMNWAQWLADLARHVPVPALALAIPIAAALERLQSEAIESAWREPFVAASRARGVVIGTLFSGSFAVEVVTSWPGLGRLMFDALKARDLFLVAGCAATGALFLAAGTLIADLLLAYSDPRIRAGERA